MFRLILGSALSAVALMIWGFVFWAGGGAEAGFSHLSPAAEASVLETLRAEFPETGTYVLPDPGVGTIDEWTARHLAGPLAFVHLTRGGTDPMSPRIYLMGFMHMFLSALMLGLIMQRALAANAGWKRRIAFAILAGVLVAFWSNLSDPVWFYEPWGYHLVTSVYDIVAYAIMGSVLGPFLHTR